ncbi:MAG: LacI family DNA-binding transcriptional regulator [Solirubrobacterales bacterium]
MSEGPRRRVTSRDIAREAGVSQPTVSRALRGDPRVATPTVELVRATARRLGYVPHAAARSLITRRAGTAAIVVADLNNPFYPELVEALHGELEAAGFRAVLFSEGTEEGGGEGVASLMRRGMVAGALAAPAPLDRPTRALLREEPGPIVLVVREVPGSGRDAVVADNRAGAALAARHLLELGHRRIGRISGPARTSTARERDAGFEAELAAAGASLDPALCRAGEYSHRSGSQLCAELLALEWQPTALFCGNDVIALGALDAARERGVAVPRRLSIVGFDDNALASWPSFRLTTVRQPLAEMAAAAAHALLRRIEAPGGEPERTAFPVSLMQRATTAPPPAPSAR